MLGQVPTGIITGVAGSLFAAPETITLDHAETYVLPDGVYYLYSTDADMDLEIQVAATPTWTKLKDGDDAPDGMIVISDGVNIRLHNSHGATDDETAKLIKIA